MGISSVFSIGDKYGRLTIIDDLGFKPIGLLGKKNRWVLCQCECGNEIEIKLTTIKNGYTKSCGCYRQEVVSKAFKKHDYLKTRLYHTWQNIKHRCYYKNNEQYPNYGGRGIIIYDKWFNNVIAFIEYCKTIDGWDNNNLSIDRINNDGNYEPGNIRFIDDCIQQRNKRKHKNNSSGYRGVTVGNDGKYGIRYRSHISHNGSVINIGSYSTPKEAVIARNNYIINNSLEEYKIQELLE